MYKKLLLTSFIILLLFLASCNYYNDSIVCPGDEPINSTNQAVHHSPVIDKRVREGDLVNFPNLKQTDLKGNKLSYEFSLPFNEKGEWQTKKGDAGEYKVQVTVSDGKTNAAQEVFVMVEKNNSPPVLVISNKEVNVKENETVVLDVKASDEDGDNVTLKFSGWMNSSTEQTSFDDAGNHVVNVEANDGRVSVYDALTVTVENVNRPPAFSSS